MSSSLRAYTRQSVDARADDRTDPKGDEVGPSQGSPQGSLRFLRNRAASEGNPRRGRLRSEGA